MDSQYIEQEALTLDKIVLDVGDINIKSILYCKARTVPNQHFTAKIIFNTSDELTPAEIEEKLYHRIVKLLKLNEDGNIDDTPLFSGIIQDYSVIKNGIYFEIEINIVSATILLDIEEKSRSFQNINMTYKDIIKVVLGDVERANLIFNKEDKKIGKPIIQYEETNWEFIKRLASHFNTYLIPETNFYLPRFYFGIKKGQDVFIKDTVEYNIKIDNRYYDKNFIGSESGIYKKDFIYYEVECNENYFVGDNVSFKGFNLKIMEKETYLTKGRLIHKYKLGNEKLFSPKEYYNKKFIGLNLKGTILQTQNEKIKVHLDIDKSQDISTAYFYEWTPETGNLMYLMPEIGTRVNLNFIDDDERNAILINSTNEENFKDSEYSKRNLTTKNNKSILIYPEKLELISNTASHYFKIEDNNGITFNSKNNFNIRASGGVTFNGGSMINVDVPEEIEIDFIVLKKLEDFDEFMTDEWCL